MTRALTDLPVALAQLKRVHAHNLSVTVVVVRELSVLHTWVGAPLYKQSCDVRVLERDSQVEGGVAVVRSGIHISIGL